MNRLLSTSIFFSAFAVYVIFRTPTSAAPLGVATIIPPSPVVVSNVLSTPKATSGTVTFSATQNTKKKKAPANTTRVTQKTIPTAAMPKRVHAKKVVQRGPYVDGTYTGRRIDSYYETVQVRIVVKNGMISKVSSLPYQIYNGTSQAIAGYAIPILRSEALTIQNADINTISGATEVSNAFRTSLASAVLQAA